MPNTSVPIPVATGFQFTEGPVWTRRRSLLFSDMPANCIYEFHDGKTRVFLEKSGFTGSDTTGLSRMIGSNAMAFDANGNLLVCMQGDHGIGMLSPGGERKLIYPQYENHPFNSPNDIVIRSDGFIFFTDPPYGLENEQLQPARFQPLAGLYCARGEEIQLLSAALHFPNGVCFSPDEKYLYLGSNHPEEPRLYRCQVDEHGRLKRMEVLAEENADGITTDRLGNLLLCSPDGLRILSPAGKRLGLIPVPEMITNCCWGGNDLYLTAEHSIFRLSPPFSWQ